MATSTAQLSELQAIDWLIAAAEKHRTDNCKWALINSPSGSSGASFTPTEITLVSGKTWQTGTRVQVTQLNPFAAGIAPLTLNTDYWAIRTSATVFGLASSRSNALAGIPISLPTISNSTDYGLAAAAPNPDWPLSELIEYEVVHPQYGARYFLPNTLPGHTISGNTVNLDIDLATISNTAATPLATNAIAIIKNGSLAPGNTTGTLLNLRPLANTITINPGDAPRLITYRFSLDFQP